MDEMCGLRGQLARSRYIRAESEAAVLALQEQKAATPENAQVVQALYLLDLTWEAEALRMEEQRLQSLRETEQLHYRQLRQRVEEIARQRKADVGGRNWLGIGGITLRVTAAWSFAIDTAIEWAQVNAPGLFRLDEKAYAKVAPEMPGAPGCWEYSYTPAIDKDLSQYLDGGDDEPTG